MLRTFLSALLACAVASCAPASPDCDPEDPASCPGEAACVEGTCVIHVDGWGEEPDGGADAPSSCDGGAIVGDGDGDGDDDPCAGPGLDDCDGDGICEYTNQNPNHCGTCGNVCAGACSGGQCVERALLEGLDGPLDLLIRDGYLYFVEHTFLGGAQGSVKRFSLRTPDVIENLASGIEGPAGLAITGEHLFFAELRWQIADALWMARKGGPPVDASIIVDDVDLEAGNTYPYGVAASQGYVFFFEDDGLRRRGVQSEIIDEVNTGGFARGLLADEAWVYWVQSGGVVKRLEVDFTTLPAPEGASLAVLPEGHRSVRAAAIGPEHLYFSSNPSGEGIIARVAKDGSTTEILVDEVDPIEAGEDDDSVAIAMAPDATHLYYLTEDYGGRLFRVPLVPGAEPELLAEVDNPGGVAVDDTWVYWAEFEEGTIQRQRKAGP